MDKCNVRMDDLLQSSIEMIAPLGDAALHKVFRQNAIDFYRLDLN